MIHAIIVFEWLMPTFHIINIGKIRAEEHLPNGRPTGRTAPAFIIVILGVGIQIMWIK